jgi:enoyl-CoA hydratase/carnithine racemase
MAVEVDQQGALRIIKMAGQASTQSFSMAFLPTIAEAIDAGLKDSATKAIVLTGDGRVFYPGGDFKAVQ